MAEEATSTLDQSLDSFIQSLFEEDVTTRANSLESTIMQTANGSYKTEKCRYWQSIQCCPFGERCVFAHGDWEKRQKNIPAKYKTKQCINFSKLGICKYGERCQFKHQLPVSEAQAQSVSTVSKTKDQCSYWQQLDNLPDLMEQSLCPRRLKVFEDFSEDSFQKINWVYKKHRSYTL